MRRHKDVHLHEVLFEFRRVGNAVKVCAIDPVTRLEITMVAPISADRETMIRLAKRKLSYVINKKMKEKMAPE